MKSLLTLALILALPLIAPSDEPPINKLTPKEIADGWAMLFDGKTTFGWSTQGTVRTRDGSLVLGGDRESSVRTVCEFGSDFEVKFEFRNDNREAEVLARVTKNGKMWDASSLERAEGEWAQGSITLKYDVEKKTHFSNISSRAKQSGNSGGRGPGSPVDRSSFGIGFLVPAGSTLEIRHIRLKPVGLKSLFNGKNLDGWKEHPGKKSKFSVTKDGWLSVKDGPGDLQTTGEWADFVLQAECRTNGKNLNSGIFFRCLPGQYQMGYEAQIHNGFGPEKEYTLEVFDPKTNKSVEKKKEKFTASDYGTGAIYRRMPARFQAANDNEWFTMTVVAQGRHFATWVNGMQTVDWTDNRPLEENARKGAYLKKGPISIQGHDPTTDLLFRNIRIAELPAR